MSVIRRPVEWFCILIKKHLLSPATWFLTALLYLFLYIFQGLVLPGDHTLSYGLMNDGAACGGAVMEFLEADTLYNAVPVTSYGALERGVASGRLDCGFVLTSGIDKAQGPEHMEGTIRYICSTSTTRGEILKEKVYAAVLRETTRSMLITILEDGLVFEDSDDPALKEDLLASYDNYLTGDDTIQVVYETVETTKTDQSHDETLPPEVQRFLAVCSILLFAAAMIFGKTRFSSDSRRLSASLAPARRRIWQFIEIFVPVMLISAMLVLPAVLKLWEARLPLRIILKAAFLLLLCGVICSLWITIYASFFRKEGYFISSLPVLLILCIVTNSSLTAGINMGGVLTVIGHLFPTAYLHL